ncbi:MAG: hypothetical protein JKY65_27210 [Planctomycetes bacterium]|nr:hypothetical protein [Planctomycetota bacterium]
MSESKTPRVGKLELGCAGLYALFLVGGALLLVSTSSGFDAYRTEANRILVIKRENWSQQDALNAQLMARAGRDRALAELRRSVAEGREPQARYVGEVGNGFSGSVAVYEVVLLKQKGQVFTLRVTGRVLDTPRPDRAFARYTVRARVSAERVEILEEKASPRPPRPR